MGEKIYYRKPAVKSVHLFIICLYLDHIEIHIPSSFFLFDVIPVVYNMHSVSMDNHYMYCANVCRWAHVCVCVQVCVLVCKCV